MVYKPPGPSYGQGGKSSSESGGYVSIPTNDNEHGQLVVHAPSHSTAKSFLVRYGRVVLILCLFFVPLTYIFVRHGSQVAAVATDGFDAIAQLGIGGNGTLGDDNGSGKQEEEEKVQGVLNVNKTNGEGEKEVVGGGEDGEDGDESEQVTKEDENEGEDEEKESDDLKAEEGNKEEEGDVNEGEEGEKMEGKAKGNETTTVSETVNVDAVVDRIEEETKQGNETAPEPEKDDDEVESDANENNGTNSEDEKEGNEGGMEESVYVDEKGNETQTEIGENPVNATEKGTGDDVVVNQDSKEVEGESKEEKTEGGSVEEQGADEKKKVKEDEEGVDTTETGKKQGEEEEGNEGEKEEVKGDGIEGQSTEGGTEEEEGDENETKEEEGEQMGNEDTIDVEKEEEEEENGEMKEVVEGEQGGEEVKATAKEKTKWFHVGVVPDDAPKCLTHDDFVFAMDGNATMMTPSGKPEGRCKKTPYVIPDENSCRAPQGEFFKYISTVTPREFDATPVVVCKQQAMPKGSCSENCSFDNIFPYIHSIGGRKEDMGPASLQWLQSLDTPRGYLNRAKNPFFFNFSAGNMSFSHDGSMVMFDINEKHLALPNQGSDDLAEGKQKVGAELGGSYYYAQVEVSSCDDQEGQVEVTTSACQTYDHFNGSYLVQCPIGTATELFFKGGSNMLSISVTMILEYTHFRGWNPAVRGTRDPVQGDRFISDAALNILVMSGVPIATVLRPMKSGDDADVGQSEARECTRDEAWNAGEFGGAWINWRGGAMTFVPTALCKLTNWDRAIKDPNVRNELSQCLTNKTGSVSMNGASHMRFAYDEIAERLGVRNRFLPLHHPDHNYLSGKLIHRHWQWFHDVNHGISNDFAANSGRTGDSLSRGLKAGDYYTLQTGAWNTAHCYNSGDNLPKYDAVVKQLMSLQEISNATFVIISSPMYPRDEVEFRHLRRNPLLQAFSEINRVYAEKLAERVKFLDFYGIGIVKANVRVCKNHFVCPEYIYSTHGLVGKVVVDAFLNGICGEVNR